MAQRGTADQPPQHCALAFPGAGDPAAACGTFDAARFHGALRTRELGHVLLTAAATASTQVAVQETAARLPSGLLFVADKQLGGKGGQAAAAAAASGCGPPGKLLGRGRCGGERWSAAARCRAAPRPLLSPGSTPAAPTSGPAPLCPQAAAATAGSRPTAA